MFHFVCVCVYVCVVCVVCVLVFSGLEDEGFTVLEQLTYLYLANNKVRHYKHSRKHRPCSFRKTNHYSSLTVTELEAGSFGPM